MTKKFYEWCFEVLRIGNRAVKKAQAENRKKGIPNVYFKNGQSYYELPDGTITTETPELYSDRTGQKILKASES